MPVPIPKLDHFQSLVTSVAVMARSASLMADAPLPEPSDAQRAAWRALTRPERVANLPLQRLNSANIELGYLTAQYADNPAYNNHSRFLPLLSNADCALLTAGLADCAAHIRDIANSGSFAAAAALQAPLIVSPGGTPEAPELAYPLMGLSLKAGRTILDNKRADTLVGHSLFRAGDLHYSEVSRYYYHQGEHRVSAASWLAGQNTPDPAALEALNAARLAAPTLHSEPDDLYLRFGAVLRSESSAELSADLPLPHVALIQDASIAPVFSSRRNPPSIGSQKLDGTKAELARAKAAQAAEAIQSLGAINVLSLALSNRQDFSLAASLASGARISSSPLASASAHTATDLLSGNHRAAGLMYAGGNLYNDFYRLAQNTHDTRSVISDERIDAIVKPFLQNSSHSRDRVSFGPLGLGLPGLSNALSKADPRLGLIQWAVSVCNFNNAQVIESAAVLSPERGALLLGMQELKSSVEQAQGVFLQHALRAAEAVESDWLAQQGLLPAWRQAKISGALSARSVAWARLNPASELLASANPMEALGARCAKAWGLRVNPAAEADFLASFKQAMGERGGHEAAWGVFSENAELRERLANITAATSVVEKATAQTARGALAFFIRAVERSAALGMDAEEINRFTRAYIEPETPSAHHLTYYHQNVEKFSFAQRLGSLSYFSTSVSIATGSWDGLSPGLGVARLSNGPVAELARDLNLGKAAQYDAMVDALAQDWIDTIDSCVKQGQTAIGAEPVARARASELAHAFPINSATESQSGALFDWRSPVFSDSPAWRLLGLPSPRYSAAVHAAPSQGHLGAWCAQIARHLNIRDAQDANDLIGKTRDAVKRLTGITDNAWRQVIKQPQALEYLRAQMKAKASPVEHQRRLPEDDQFSIRQSRTPNYTPGTPDSVHALEAGRLFSMAATMNLPLDKALRAGRSLPSELFGSTIGVLDLGGADGAGFYIAELDAKRSRAPYILKEAVKRLEKLDQDALAPVQQGHTRQTAEQAFSAETTDLADWIKNSEPGLWQELPAIPTWKQLRRASAEWHEEQAAIARDKNERRAAKEARDAANQILLHVDDASGDANQDIKVGARNLMGEFANPAGSAWPKALGRYARDGWEAIELLNAAQLTEEGAAMSHCVSSYSGQCRSGSARIFSIRLNGERVSTLQISGFEVLAKLDENAQFRLAQNRGKHNAAITSNAALDFCQETLAAFSSSWSALCLKRRALIEAEIARKKAEAKALEKKANAPEGALEPDAPKTRARKTPKAA